MKTLKKVLSLVLVVAMIASMLIVGAAAAEEESNYPEAVAVVTGIGVIEGDENGLRLGDTVTRAEAAAIICRLLLGETAETLKTSVSPFADVKATDWFAPYVAYLKGLGVVSGVGGNNFAPKANVTGLQFSKMLLVALGYNAIGEYEAETADAWEINIVADAFGNGIYEGTKTMDLDAPATREECMLYAFNALTVPTVKYNKSFETYYTGKSVLDVADTQAELMEYTLAALKFNLEATPANDFYGRPAANYVIGNDILALRVPTAEADFELSNVIYGADLYNKLGATAAKIDNITVWTDGALDAATAGQIVLSPYASAIYGSPALTAQGAHIEGYVSVNGEDTNLTLVVWYEYMSPVASYDYNTGITTLASGSIGVLEGGKDAIPYVTNYIYTASPAATLVAPYCDITSAVVATPAVLTFDKVMTVAGTTHYVFGGQDYVASANVIAPMPAATAAGLGAAYYVYTDSLGNILLATAVDTSLKSSNYVYVADHAMAAAVPGINGAPMSAKLEVVYATGGYAIVNHATFVDFDGQVKLNTLNTKLTLAEAQAAINDGAWYSYIANEDGTITLVDEVDVIGTAPNTIPVVDTTLVVNTGKYSVSNFGAFKATSTTVLNLVNAQGQRVTYTGIANFPNINDTYAVMVETDMFYNIVTINAYTTGALPTTSVANVAYCAQELYTDAYGTHYIFYINGQPVEIATTAKVVGKVYDINLVNGLYFVGNEVASYASAYELYRGTVNNKITAVDDQYFTVKVSYDPANYATQSYYYNAAGYPTVIFDLQTGTTGTLTVGRNATVVHTSGNATVIFLH